MWFGDERGYNATQNLFGNLDELLWFGDERGYNATDSHSHLHGVGCGLVMKEDITQLLVVCWLLVKVVVW